MNAEQVFKYFRAYKFFYNDKQNKFGVLKHPPLIKQFDRVFYYRLAKKMPDAQIHALFTLGFFFNPSAHVSDLVTPDAQKAALAFVGRAENGVEMIKHDLYALRKRLPDAEVVTWLYAECMPPCLGDVLSGELSPDLACVLLLIPQPSLHYDWPAYWAAQPDLGLGAQPWIARLKKLDQLLRMHRPTWRITTQPLAAEFWRSYSLTSLAPTQNSEDPTLF